jgi:hypothetical protein
VEESQNSEWTLFDGGKKFRSTRGVPPIVRVAINGVPEAEKAARVTEAAATPEKMIHDDNILLAPLGIVLTSQVRN